MLSGAIVYPIGLAIALVVVARRQEWPRTILALIAVAHVTILVSVALFPIPLDPDQVTGFRAGVLHSAERSAPNFVPFASIGQVLSGHGARGTTLLLVLNLFVLFPAGMYLPLLVSRLRRPVALLPLAILGGASIEVAQLAISSALGFRYRFIDVDDAILNGLGLVLGWLVVFVAFAFESRLPHRRT
jgi:glycopeptide antibiotics resistance protein